MVLPDGTGAVAPLCFAFTALLAVVIRRTPGAVAGLCSFWCGMLAACLPPACCRVGALIAIMRHARPIPAAFNRYSCDLHALVGLLAACEASAGEPELLGAGPRYLHCGSIIWEVRRMETTSSNLRRR